MGLTAVASYDVTNSLHNYSSNNSKPSVQSQLLSALQEMNEQFACTENNVSDLRGIVANITAVGVFPRSSENNDDESTNMNASIDYIKSLLTSSGKC